LATRAGAEKVAEEILSKLAVPTPQVLLAPSSAAAGGGGKAHASTIPSRDERILPLLREEGKEKFRSIMVTAADSHEKDFGCWPLDNVRSMKGAVRHHRMVNQTFRQSHTSWKQSPGVRAKDRSTHEGSVLSTAIDLTQYYDQLDIVNVAAFEVLTKQRMLLEQSVEGRPENPSFAGAERFMGYQDGEAGYIDPAARAFQAARMREENAITREAGLRREELASAGEGASKGSGG
jgi:hypothetical protein